MSVTWVALLRGINVGRAKRITMADLRAMLESIGHGEVRTHGQSGNAIFTSARSNAEPLEREISARIKGDFGMDVVVMVRTAAEFAKVVDANPFVTPGADTSKLHVAFLSAQPAASVLAGVDREACMPDEFAFGDRAIYVRLPNGVMGTTLPDWERTLGVRVTQRNWNTTLKLRDLAGS